MHSAFKVRECGTVAPTLVPCDDLDDCPPHCDVSPPLPRTHHCETHARFEQTFRGWCFAILAPFSNERSTLRRRVFDASLSRTAVLATVLFVHRLTVARSGLSPLVPLHLFNFADTVVALAVPTDFLLPPRQATRRRRTSYLIPVRAHHTHV